MSQKLNRRNALKLFTVGGAASIVSAIAPAPAAAETIVVEKVAPWADEWPPTALPGKLARCTPQDPCPRCGGRHEHYTVGCLPAYWVTDEYGNITAPQNPEDAPDGLHVMEITMSGDGRRRYAVVRHRKE